jgi:hypothetical protein
LDEEVADAVEQLIRSRFDGRGAMLVRIGRAPKRLIPFCTDVPFGKRLLCYVAPNGKPQKVEFLGRGQQAVFYGTHKSGKPYHWHADRDPLKVPPEEWVKITEAEVDQLLAEIDELLTEQFSYTRSAVPNPDGSPRTTLQVTDVDAAFASLHYAGVGGGGNIHDTALGCINALLLQGTPVQDAVEEVLAALRAYAATNLLCTNWDWEKRHHRLEGMAYSLINKYPDLAPMLPNDLYAEHNRIVAGGGTPWLQWNRTHKTWRVTDKAPGPETSSSQTNGAEQPAAVIEQWPTAYSKRDPKRIPLRKFVLGMHYLLGVVTLTAAAGGVGKSVLTLLEAVSFAIGRDLLLGTPLERRYRAWVWNAEDDIDEMERRVAGICAHYNVNRADLDGWLYLDSGYDLPLDLAQSNGKVAVVQEGRIAMITDRVKELGIEIVGLDPLVALHTLPEGDNPSLAKLIRLAKPCGCAVDINHHTRKPAAGQEGMTVDDIRGAGTIVYSVRSGRMLHQMSLADAEKYSIEADDRFAYFRLERAKANMAKRGTICWVQLIEKAIANGPDGASGDVVTVPTLWTPPDAMEGVSNDVAAAIWSYSRKLVTA